MTGCPRESIFNILWTTILNIKLDKWRWLQVLHCHKPISTNHVVSKKSVNWSWTFEIILPDIFLIDDYMIKSFYIHKPNAVTIQYIALFSNLYVLLPASSEVENIWRVPSLAFSQKQELAVCKPAPLRCMKIQVTDSISTESHNRIPIYLKGLLREVSLRIEFSITSFVHWGTLLWLYAVEGCITDSTDWAKWDNQCMIRATSRSAAWTSSGTNAAYNTSATNFVVLNTTSSDDCKSSMVSPHPAFVAHAAKGASTRIRGAYYSRNYENIL